WALPLAMFAASLLLATLEFARVAYFGLRAAGLTRLSWILWSIALLVMLIFAGCFLPFESWATEKPMPLAQRIMLPWGEDWNRESEFSLFHRVLLPWQNDPALLQLAFWTWFAAAVGLLFGVGTRAMAIAVWIFSVSFAHSNSYIDNAGDVV